MADRIADIGRLLPSRPTASIGIDAPQRVEEIEHHVGDLRLDHDLHGLVNEHGPRHAGVVATDRLRIAPPAALAVRLRRHEPRLVFRVERRVLAKVARLARVPSRDIHVGPLAGPVRICPSACAGMPTALSIVARANESIDHRAIMRLSPLADGSGRGAIGGFSRAFFSGFSGGVETGFPRRDSLSQHPRRRCATLFTSRSGCGRP